MKFKSYSMNMSFMKSITMTMMNQLVVNQEDKDLDKI